MLGRLQGGAGEHQNRRGGAKNERACLSFHRQHVAFDGRSNGLSFAEGGLREYQNGTAALLRG
jgi:hypothetical protein